MSQQIVTIERLGQRGDGVAHTAEGSLFVAGALPGERVSVMGAGERGELLSIETASPERAAPFCPLAGRCGGCATQHMSQTLYRSWKRDMLAETLARAGVDVALSEMIDAHGEGRRRATFHARREGGGWSVGFMAARSHDIVPLEHCPVLEPRLTRAPQIAAQLAARLGGSKPLDIQITATEGGLDVDIRGHGPLNDRGRTQAMIALADALDLARLSLHGEILVERRPPFVAMGRAMVAPGGGGFLQATAAGEAALARLVLEAVPPKTKRIVDLFSGCGPFALRLAEQAQVHAVDGDKAAIQALDKGFRGARGLKTVTSETRDLFRRPLLKGELAGYDMAVLDPPRAGAEAQVGQLVDSKIKNITYVSCNSASFSRDAVTLMKGGYALLAVHPVDQFRYSAHIELVAQFRRQNG